MSTIGNNMFDGNMVKGKIEAAKESLKGLRADESGESSLTNITDTVVVSAANGIVPSIIGGFVGGIAGVSSVADQANLADYGIGTNPTIGEALGTIGGGIAKGVIGGFALGALATAIVVSLA